MTYEVGKVYKTRDGRKAQIFMLDNGNGMMLGCVHTCETWSPCMWRSEGDCLADEITRSDLMSEWHDPVKYSVEIWASGPLSPNPESEHIHNYIFGNKIGWNKHKTGTLSKYLITVEEIAE